MPPTEMDFWILWILWILGFSDTCALSVHKGLLGRTRRSSAKLKRRGVMRSMMWRPSVSCCRQDTRSETPPLLRRLASPWRKVDEVEVREGASCANRLPGPSVLVQPFGLLMSSTPGPCSRRGSRRRGCCRRERIRDVHVCAGRRRDLNDLLMCIARMVLVILEMSILCRRVDRKLPAHGCKMSVRRLGPRHRSSQTVRVVRHLSQNGYGCM